MKANSTMGSYIKNFAIGPKLFWTGPKMGQKVQIFTQIKKKNDKQDPEILLCSQNNTEV